MDRATLERAFEPFVGLGLPVVHGLVTEMRGTVTFESAPGEGTTVTVLLPVHEGMKELPAMASILLIDDVPAVLISLRIVLQGSGHQVTAVGDGDRGLDLLRTQGFDVVITDIWMPGSSGTTVISEGRRLSPRARFIAITGGDPNGPANSARLPDSDFGADCVLLKPFEKSELLAAVAGLLEGR
jgi:CheY-like chemotaxis protein